ncbi:MAG: hypothetical protein AAF555_10960 [Verrucomicrobiota bacterium]
MKRRSLFALTLLAISVTSSRALPPPEVPRKQDVSRYRLLWQNSAITERKAAPLLAPPEEVRFSDSLALSGLARRGDRWSVYLIDRETKESIILQAAVGETDRASGIRLLAVENFEQYQLTSVRLSKGSQQGVVQRDEELLARKSSPQTVLQANNNQPTAGVQPGQPPPETPASRINRRRVIPTPPNR